MSTPNVKERRKEVRSEGVYTAFLRAMTKRKREREREATLTGKAVDVTTAMWPLILLLPVPVTLSLNLPLTVTVLCVAAVIKTKKRIVFGTEKRRERREGKCERMSWRKKEKRSVKKKERRSKKSNTNARGRELEQLKGKKGTWREKG
jgi:hypothetical protein